MTINREELAELCDAFVKMTKIVKNVRSQD